MLVQFIIIFPILFALGMFVLVYGMALYSKNTLNIASRESARICAHATSPDGDDKAKNDAVKIAAEIISRNMNIREETAAGMVSLDDRYMVSGERYCRSAVSYTLPMPVYSIGDFKVLKHGISLNSEALFKKESLETGEENNDPE